MDNVINLSTGSRLPDTEKALGMLLVPYRLLGESTEELLHVCICLEKAAIAGGGRLAIKRVSAALQRYLEKHSQLMMELQPIFERMAEIYRPTLSPERSVAAKTALEVVSVAILEADIMGESILEAIDRGGFGLEWIEAQTLRLGAVLDRLRLFYCWFAEILFSSDLALISEIAAACDRTWLLMKQTYHGE